MSQYAENNLTQGEKIVLKAKKSPLVLIPYAINCVVILIAVIIVVSILSKYLSNLLEESGMEIEDLVLDNFNFGKFLKAIKYVVWFIGILVGILPLIFAIIELFSSCLCITNKRVIGKVGVLGVKTIDYPIEKVDNINMSAGFWGKIFHFYKINIHGGGNDPRDMRLAFKGITNAPEFKNTVTAAIEHHAQEARKAQAEEIARAMSGRANP